MSRLRTLIPLGILCVLVVACAKEPDKPPAPSAPLPPAATKKAALVLGSPVTAETVALSEVAKNPRSYEARPFATAGTVTAVCQNMGCWMEIQDETSHAHIRMHGHSFFIPKTASGRHARVEATVVPKEEAKECDESPSSGSSPTEPSETLAKVELDATGVELD